MAYASSASSLLQGLTSSTFTFPALNQQPWSLAGIKAAPLDPRAEPAPVDSPAEQNPVSWWKHATPVKEAAPPAAAALDPLPPSASKAARAEPAPVTSPADQDPAAGHQPASLWAEVAKSVKAAIPSTTPETPAGATLPAASKADSIPARPTAAKPAETPVHRAPSRQPAATMGSCPAQDLRAVQYTAAVSAALLTVMIIWSVARCMVPAGTRYGVCRHKRSPSGTCIVSTAERQMQCM